MVFVGALHGAHRAGAGLAEQAHPADHCRGHAAGQLLRIDIHSGRSLARPGQPACIGPPSAGLSANSPGIVLDR